MHLDQSRLVIEAIDVRDRSEHVKLNHALRTCRELSCTKHPSVRLNGTCTVGNRTNAAVRAEQFGCSQSANAGASPQHEAPAGEIHSFDDVVEHGNSPGSAQRSE